MSRTKRWSPLALFGTVCDRLQPPVQGRRAPESRARPRRARRRARRLQPGDRQPGGRRSGRIRPTARPRAASPRTPARSRRSRRSTRQTVEFQLCTPDVAVPAEGRVQRSFGIQDSDYLEKHAADKSYLDQPNGTGPVQAQAVGQGQPDRLRGQPRLLGHKGPDPEPRVPLERRGGPAAPRPAVRRRRRHRQPRHRGHRRRSRRTPRSSSTSRDRPEHRSTSASTTRQAPWTDEKVRQAIAMGIDRERIVKNFYPEGSTVADYFTPCAIVPFACEGDDTWGFDAAAAKAAPDRRQLPDGFKTKPQSFRARGPRLQLPDPPPDRDRDQEPAQDQPRDQATLDLQESGTFLDNTPPARSTGYPARLGRGLPGIDQLPRLPLRLGLGQEVRQPVRRHRRRP